MGSRSATLSHPRVRPTGRAAILAALLTALLLVSAQPVRQYLGERSRIAELARQSQMLDRANADLEQQIARLHDPAELERLARECLGLVESGEIAFVVVPKHGRRAPPPC